MSPIELQNLISEYYRYYQMQQIDKNELVSLLQGIDIMEDLGNDIDDMNAKQQMHQILTTAINAASLLA